MTYPGGYHSRALGFNVLVVLVDGWWSCIVVDVMRVWRCYAPPHSPKAWGLKPEGWSLFVVHRQAGLHFFTWKTEGEEARGATNVSCRACCGEL